MKECTRGLPKRVYVESVPSQICSGLGDTRQEAAPTTRHISRDAERVEPLQERGHPHARVPSPRSPSRARESYVEVSETTRYGASYCLSQRNEHVALTSSEGTLCDQIVGLIDECSQ